MNQRKPIRQFSVRDGSRASVSSNETDPCQRQNIWLLQFLLLIFSNQHLKYDLPYLWCDEPDRGENAPVEPDGVPDAFRLVEQSDGIRATEWLCIKSWRVVPMTQGLSECPSPTLGKTGPSRTSHYEGFIFSLLILSSSVFIRRHQHVQGLTRQAPVPMVPGSDLPAHPL